ncbi:MAG: hypothetical protein HYY17_12710 [Planctomycetes bacterium]|nr:hypothetical protein [Planctomycetota bacterium]
MLHLVATVCLLAGSDGIAVHPRPVTAVLQDECPKWRKKIYKFLRDRIREIPEDDMREIMKLGMEFFDRMPQDSKDDVAKRLQAEIMKLFAPKKKDK